MVPVLETPAYQRTLADRPGYREFTETQVGRSLRDHVGRDGGRARVPTRRSRRARGRRALPDARASSASQDAPLLGPSRAMADAIEGAQLVDHPRRRALTAVRESAGVDRRAVAVPRVGSGADEVASRSWTRTAAGSRSRCCSATTSTRCSRCRAGISSCSTTARCRRGCGSSTCGTNRARRSRPRASPR